jgi:hypothetical protein
VESQLRGIWTTAELRAAGLSSRQIERLVGKGALCPLLTGVYASAAAAAATIGEARDDRARAQLERDARLRAAGYEVVHFTWAQITRVPAQVVDSIRVAFSRGARSVPPGRPGGP